MKKLLVIFIAVGTLGTIWLGVHFNKNHTDFIKKEMLRFGKDLKPDNPDLAAFMNFLQTVDPETQKVPVERLYNAQKKADAQQIRRAGRNNWEQIPTVMGGRTRVLAWDPNDETQSKVWAGSVSGGLWYNENIHEVTSPWVPADDFWPSLAVSSIVFDPNDPQTMYVGTGEAETAVITYRESGGRGAGIMKSTDGGETWQLLESTEDFYYVTDLAMRNEGDQSVIYAGVTSGVYMGEDHNSAPSNGLYRSTDHGATWTQVLPETEGTGVSPVGDIEVEGNGRIFIGTTNNKDGQKGSEILYSDEGTAGSWIRYNTIADQIVQNDSYNLTGRVKLAVAPSDPNTVYAVYAVGTNDDLLQGFPTWEGRIFQKSIDNGETWTDVNLPPTSGSQWAYLAWHALIIEVDPNNPDRIWAGGLDLHRSDDGGETWEHYSDWADMYYGGGPQYVHADQHAVAYQPGSSSIALFATDGGVFYTENADGATTFADHNMDFNTLQFYSGKISPFAGDEECLGGLQDNGSLLYDGTPLSADVMVSGGDGGYCYFDPTRQGAFISTVYENTFLIYQNNYNNNYINNYTSGTFTSPFAVDFEEEQIFANAVSFTGQHQDELLILQNIFGYHGGDFVSAGTGSQVPFSYVSRTPYSDSDDILFLGTADGKLFKVIFDGSNITSTTEITGTEFPEGFISCIAHGETEEIMMVVFSNYGVTSLWLTEDGGQSWTNAERNLPDVPTRYAVFHPEDSRQVMLATELGVWENTDIFNETSQWELDSNFPTVRTDMLDVRSADNTLLAATHGRGLFTTEWESLYGSGIMQTPVAKLEVMPNPVKVNQNVAIVSPASGAYSLRITSTSGQNLKMQKGAISKGEKLTVKMENSGINILTLEIDGRQFVSKVMVR